MHRGLARVLVVCLVATLLMGCRPVRVDPGSANDGRVGLPCLQAVVPVPGSVVSKVAEIRLEFSHKVREARLVAFHWSRMSDPRCEGSSLVWELDTDRPAGNWHIIVVGSVTFASGQTLELEQSFGFTVAPEPRPYQIRFGQPAAAHVSFGDSTWYVVVTGDGTALHAGASAASPVVGELPPGTMLSVISEQEGLLQVTAVEAESAAMFVQTPSTGQHPQPSSTAWVASDSVCRLPPPWSERAVVSSAVNPPSLLVADRQEPYALQYRLGSHVTPGEIQTAVTYAAFWAAMRETCRLLVPLSSDTAAGGEVDFMVKSADGWFEERLNELGATSWPVEFTAYKAKAFQFAEQYRDATEACLRLLDPASREVSFDELTVMLRAGGCDVPARSDPFEDWGDAVRGLLSGSVAAVQRDLIASMEPGLVPLVEEEE